MYLFINGLYSYEKLFIHICVNVRCCSIDIRSNHILCHVYLHLLHTCVRNMLEIKYTFIGRIYIYYILPAACIRNNSGYESLFEYVKYRQI